MKPNVALLKADIRDELDKIARLSLNDFRRTLFGYAYGIMQV
jgi:hypothetical protein